MPELIRLYISRSSKWSLCFSHIMNFSKNILPNYIPSNSKSSLLTSLSFPIIISSLLYISFSYSLCIIVPMHLATLFLKYGWMSAFRVYIFYRFLFKNNYSSAPYFTSTNGVITSLLWNSPSSISYTSSKNLKENSSGLSTINNVF